MARPVKQGVDYFPLDVHMDDKMRFIEVKHGLEGFAVVIKLYQKIYSVGYYYPLGEDEKLLFANDIGITPEKLEEIVNECVKRGIFDRESYEKSNVLTSKGIQKRFAEMINRRKKAEIDDSHVLCDELMHAITRVNVDSNSVNVDSNSRSSVVNVDNNTQRKGKETKSNKKESKREGDKTKEPTPERKIIPPSIDMVRDYCNERGNNIDPERFVDYYESVGWYVNNKRMKDWQAAVRTWEKREGGGNGGRDSEKNRKYPKGSFDHLVNVGM